MNQIEKTLQKEWKNRILILTMYGFEVRVKFFRTNCEIIVSFFFMQICRPKNNTQRRFLACIDDKPIEKLAGKLHED